MNRTPFTYPPGPRGEKKEPGTKGAVAIEKILIAMVLFICIFFIIDLCLFVLARAEIRRMLNVAAISAGYMPNLDLDLGNNCQNAATVLCQGDPTCIASEKTKCEQIAQFDCVMYNEAIYRVEKTARDLMSSTGLVIRDINVPSQIKLYPLTYDPLGLSASCIDPAREHRIAILRPGESATVHKELTTETITHQTLPPTSNLRPDESIKSLLQNHQLYLHGQVKFDDILGLFTGTVREVVPIARQPIPRGPFGELHNWNGTNCAPEVDPDAVCKNTLTDPLSPPTPQNMADPATMPGAVVNGCPVVKWQNCISARMCPNPATGCTCTLPCTNTSGM